MSNSRLSKRFEVNLKSEFCTLSGGFKEFEKAVEYCRFLYSKGLAPSIKDSWTSRTYTEFAPGHEVITYRERVFQQYSKGRKLGEKPLPRKDIEDFVETYNLNLIENLSDLGKEFKELVDELARAVDIAHEDLKRLKAVSKDLWEKSSSKLPI